MIQISVHPIEHRYGCDYLRRLFSVDNMYRVMAQVEYLVVRAQEKRGIVPKGTSEALRRAMESLSAEEVFREERRVKHDVMALINVLSRRMGELGEYIHIGITSADLRDTAKILIIRDALNHIEEKLCGLLETLVGLAERHAELPCVGRTHGVHASVYLFGRKFAIFADEIMRHLERISDMKRRLLVGKISGPVGIHTALGEVGEQIEREVLGELGLHVDVSATQVISRDRLAELFLVLALISTTLEKIATEIRNLHRTEIGEAEEGFAEEQVGSTAMPHKRNPIDCENICSLSRVVRGLTIPALENIVLWHERDLTNSASERILIPEVFMLVDEQISRMIRVLRGVRVDEDRIRRNMEMMCGAIYSEILTTMLALRGYGRQKAHERLRRISMEAHRTKRCLRELIEADGELMEALGESLDRIFNPSRYLGVAKRRTLETIRTVREFLRKRKAQSSARR